MIQQISHSEDLAGAMELAQAQPILLFKHSAICSTSIRAKRQFVEFCEAYPEVPAFFVVVQTHRSISNQIATDFDIKHESPQIFLIADGNVLWHTSHGKIQHTAIEKAFELI